jgi:hypothetical protein
VVGQHEAHTSRRPQSGSPRLQVTSWHEGHKIDLAVPDRRHRARQQRGRGHLPEPRFRRSGQDPPGNGDALFRHAERRARVRVDTGCGRRRCDPQRPIRPILALLRRGQRLRRCQSCRVEPDQRHPPGARRPEDSGDWFAHRQCRYRHDGGLRHLSCEPGSTASKPARSKSSSTRRACAPKLGWPPIQANTTEGSFRSCQSVNSPPI